MQDDTKFFIVDVFAREKYAGNQLAVFPNASNFSTEQMQQLALEMNYSESTFICSGKTENGGYDVRIFTPVEEVPFAGHPTLGTAFVINNLLRDQPEEVVRLNLQVGQILVQVDPEQSSYFWMQQNTPEFGEVLNRDEMARVLNLPSTAIHPDFPVVVVSTGLPFIIVPLTSLKAVRDAVMDQQSYEGFLRDVSTKAVLIFTDETESLESDLHARVFAGYYGVPEDPATGSANGCLAGYLCRYGYFGASDVDVRVEQGAEINRSSELLLRASQHDDQISVDVGGQVIPVAEGILL